MIRFCSKYVSLLITVSCPYTLATVLPLIDIAPVWSDTSYNPVTVWPPGVLTDGRSSCHWSGYPIISFSELIIVLLLVV